MTSPTARENLKNPKMIEKKNEAGHQRNQHHHKSNATYEHQRPRPASLERSERLRYERNNRSAEVILNVSIIAHFKQSRSFCGSRNNKPQSKRQGKPDQLQLETIRAGWRLGLSRHINYLKDARIKTCRRHSSLLKRILLPQQRRVAISQTLRVGLRRDVCDGRVRYGHCWRSAHVRRSGQDLLFSFKLALNDCKLCLLVGKLAAQSAKFARFA